jgi:hypothetical protein
VAGRPGKVAGPAEKLSRPAAASSVPDCAPGFARGDDRRSTTPNLTDMPDELPWAEYRRGRLRPGMSYPVGRGLIERSLRDAGVTVGSLDFAVPVAGHPVSPGNQDIIEVHWFGRSRSRRLANASLAPADALFLRVWAVHCARRHEVSVLLADALPIACRWMAAALAREPDSVWSAQNHELIVRYGNHAIATHER